MSRRKQSKPRHLESQPFGENGLISQEADALSDSLYCFGCQTEFGDDADEFEVHLKTCVATDGEGDQPQSPPTEDPTTPPPLHPDMALFRNKESLHPGLSSDVSEDNASDDEGADTSPRPTSGQNGASHRALALVERSTSAAHLEPPRKLIRRNSDSLPSDARESNTAPDKKQTLPPTDRDQSRSSTDSSPFSSHQSTNHQNSSHRPITQSSSSLSSSSFQANTEPRNLVMGDEGLRLRMADKSDNYSEEDDFQHRNHADDPEEEDGHHGSQEEARLSDDGSGQRLHRPPSKTNHHHHRKQESNSSKRGDGPETDIDGAVDFRRGARGGDDADDEDDDEDDHLGRGGSGGGRYSPRHAHSGSSNALIDPHSPMGAPGAIPPHPDLPHASPHDLPGSPMSASAASPPLNLSGNNVTLEPLENTKVAMAQFAEKTALLLQGLNANPPGDINVLQSTLTQLQRQQLMQLQLIQQLQHSLVTGALFPPDAPGAPDANHAKQIAATLATLQSLPLLANFNPTNLLPDNPLLKTGASSPVDMPPKLYPHNKDPGSRPGSRPGTPHSATHDGDVSPRPLPPVSPPPHDVSNPPSPAPSPVPRTKDDAEAGVTPSPLDLLQQTTATFNALSSLEKKFKGMFEGIPTYNDKSPIGLNPQTAAALHRSVSDDPYYKHRCRICNKAFGSESALQIHIRSHTGERPFKCNICGNRFSTKGNLKVHFARHRDKYPHIPMNPNPVPEHLDDMQPPLEPPSPPLPLPPLSSSSMPSSMAPFSLPPSSISSFASHLFGSLLPSVSPSLSLPSAVPLPASVSSSPTSPTPHSSAQAIPLSTTEPSKSSSALSAPSSSTTASTPQEGDRASARSTSPTSRGSGRGYNSSHPMSHHHHMNATSPAAAAEGGHPSSGSDSRRFSLGSLSSVNLQKSPTTAASTAPDRKSPDITGKAMTSSSSSLNGMHNLGNPINKTSPSSSHASTPLSVDTSFANGNPINPLTDNLPCISPNAPLEKYMEISTPETSKLQQLVDNIENKLADPNQCCICNRILSCKSALQMHYRTHTGERPFRCKLCGRAFTTKGNLKTHMGVHKAKPPLRVLHQCPVCHKQFTNAIVLQQHIRLHTGEISEEQERSIRESLAREELKDMYPQIPQIPPHGFLPGFMQSALQGLPIPPGGLDLRAALQSQASFASMAAGLDLSHSSLAQDSNDEDEAGIDLSQKKQLAITNSEQVTEEHNRDEQRNTPSPRPVKSEKISKDNHGFDEDDEPKSRAASLVGEDAPSPSSTAIPSNHTSAISTSLVALENTVKGISAGAQHSALSFYKSHLGFGPYGMTSKLAGSESALKSPVDMRMSPPLKTTESQKGDTDANVDSKPFNNCGESRSDRSDASSPYTVASEGRSAHSDPCIPPSPAASEGGALDLTPRSSSGSGHYATAFRDAIEAGHVPNHPISSLGSLIPPPPPSGLFPSLGASPYPGTLSVPGLTGGSRNTTCDICFKTFACRSALEIHYRSHTKERPFKCDICERAFSTRGNMKQHMLTHKIRDIPSRAFSEEDSEASRHQNDIGSQQNSPEHFNDKQDSDGQYDKPLALTPASPQSSLASVPSPSHQGGFSLPPPPPMGGHFPATSLPSSLRSLAFPHGMPSSVPQESSGLSAAVPSSSAASSSRHSSGANEGSSSGSGSSSSNRHKPTPSNRQCQVCHKYFSSASAVQIHMRTHTGEKPFKCSICSRAFTTKGNLKVHMGTHMWNNGPSRRGRRMSVDVPFGAVPPGHPGVLTHPRLPKENMFPPGHPGVGGAPGPDARGLYPPGALRGFPPASVADFYQGYPLGLVNGMGPKINEISVIQSLNGANAMNRFHAPHLLTPPGMLRGEVGSQQRPQSHNFDDHSFNNNEINLSTKKSNRSEPSTSPRESYNHSPRSRSSSPENSHNNQSPRQRSLSPASRKRPRSFTPPPPVLDLPKPLSPGSHLGFPLFPVPPAMANSWASLWKAHSEASAVSMAAAAAAAANASATDLSARKSSASPSGYESRERSRSRSPAPTRSPNSSPLHQPSAATLTATTSISSTGATRSPGSSGSPGSSPNPGTQSGVASRHPRDSPPAWRMWKPSSHEMKQVS